MKARTWFPVLAALLLLAVTSPFRSAAADAPAPKAMTNDDIVKMIKLGFGDEVVVAKIEEAPSVAFKTGIDDLEALKKDGASDAVISAMVARQGKAEAPPPAAAAPGAEQAAVELVTKDKGTVSLTSEAGTTSTAYAYVTMLMFSNFDGQHAKVRTTDRHPSLVVRSEKNPEGRFWFVSAEVDDDDNVRSVKMGNMGMFKSKNLNAPDTDNRIKCTVEQTGKDTWTYTPKKDLKKGEYGIWYSAGTAGATAPGGEMFDFGVD
jgi:hypothetical protein